jgi:RNA polymerase sigma-70 factor (ECF subfamily)
MTAQVLPLRRVEGKPEALSDAALLAACALGDQAALGTLFDRHHGAVYRFIARLSQTNAADLDDLVQNTFLTVQRSARRYQGRSAVRTWILGIAANTVRREARSRGRRQRLAAVMAETPRTAPQTVDTLVDQRQAVAHLQQALAELPEKFRVCFVLCQLEGVPGPEAAAILGIRVGTLYRRIHTARKRLSAALEAHR